MSEVKRLSRVAKECNVGIQTIVDFLHKKGFTIENNPNAKIPPESQENSAVDGLDPSWSRKDETTTPPTQY